MKRNTIVSILATALVALVGATAAVAGGTHGKTLYRFVGQLQSTPSSPSLTVAVQSGNGPALRALLGQSQVQTFSTGERTEFLKWSQGIPAVVSIGDLAKDDYVVINIRADRGATLADLEATAPGIVGDHGPTLNPPNKPLYLFRGTLVSTADGKVTVDVKGGDRRALRLLIGQPAQQTFTTGSETVFLHWQGRVPTVTSATGLKVGDRVIVRIRAAQGTSLADIEATPARRVAEHEPAAQEAAQNAQA
jgi:hypothetical protein